MRRERVFIRVGECERKEGLFVGGGGDCRRGMSRYKDEMKRNERDVKKWAGTEKSEQRSSKKKKRSINIDKRIFIAFFLWGPTVTCIVPLHPRDRQPCFCQCLFSSQ